MPYTSKKPLPNSRRYMYYNYRKSPRYVYIIDNAPEPSSLSKSGMISILIFLILSLIGVVLIIAPSLKQAMPPKKLSPLSEYENVHIQDNASEFKYEEEIEATLRSFEDLTGICPYIITVYDSNWGEKYTSLSDYMHSLYVNNFSDEQHFLIVCSKSDNASESALLKWKVQTMAGEDTDKILDESAMIAFNNDLETYLKMDSVTTDDAFIKTFNNSKDYLMSGDVNNPQVHDMFFVLASFTVTIAFVAFLVIRKYFIGNREYIPAPEEQQCYIDIIK